MIAYASRTGTRRNLAALRDAGWRLMVSARGVLRTEGFAFSLDNGAWTAHQRGEPFDTPAFERALGLLGSTADFVVLPDIVCGGAASLTLSMRWLPRVLEVARLALLPVQDGMRSEEIAPLLSERVGIFVGGSDAWKEQTAELWGSIGRGRWVHVGRVNTARRISICAHAGATSFDGSSASRFATTLPMLDRARRQSALFGRS